MNRTDSSLIKIENESYSTTGPLRSVGIALRATQTEAVIILHGDLVFSPQTLQFPLNKSLLVVDNNFMNENEVGLTICDGEIEYLYYDLPKKWAQASFFCKKELKLLKGVAWNPDKNKLFLFEAINHIIEKGGRFMAYEHPDVKVIDVDKPSDIQRAQQLIKGNL